MSATEKVVAPQQTDVAGETAADRQGTALRYVDFDGHTVEVIIAADEDAGYGAASTVTPLWFGYGSTPDAAFESYCAVAATALEYMHDQGRGFKPA